MLFSERENPLETFELWDQTRVMIRHPPIDQEPAWAGGWTGGWRWRSAIAHGFGCEPMTMRQQKSSAELTQINACWPRSAMLHASSAKCVRKHLE